MTFVPLLVLAAATLASAAQAAEFKSVGNDPAILYDAPSERGRKVFIAPRGMPVEIVLTYGDWSKVRDVAGDLAWVETRALAGKRNVIVRAATARILANPEDNAQPVFVAERGVMLELTEPPASAWIKVRHRDGQTGFARALDVWGD